MKKTPKKKLKDQFENKEWFSKKLKLISLRNYFRVKFMSTFWKKKRKTWFYLKKNNNKIYNVFIVTVYGNKNGEIISVYLV